MYSEPDRVESIPASGRCGGLLQEGRHHNGSLFTTHSGQEVGRARAGRDGKEVSAGHE